MINDLILAEMSLVCGGECLTCCCICECKYNNISCDDGTDEKCCLVSYGKYKSIYFRKGEFIDLGSTDSMTACRNVCEDWGNMNSCDLTILCEAYNKVDKEICEFRKKC